ncbi:hypothetical protein NQ318_020655 [Aromia moschata]|uniref:Uncharacterized protein n=1 Tax=Aromia moschata TaxID=1265417 RepID=A0AAV8X164_9CUCU|nr:hypothetical protein NQ318_020655 [Aromia moschata]
MKDGDNVVSSSTDIIIDNYVDTSPLNVEEGDFNVARGDIDDVMNSTPPPTLYPIDTPWYTKECRDCGIMFCFCSKSLEWHQPHRESQIADEDDLKCPETFELSYSPSPPLPPKIWEGDDCEVEMRLLATEGPPRSPSPPPLTPTGGNVSSDESLRIRHIMY